MATVAHLAAGVCSRIQSSSGVIVTVPVRNRSGLPETVWLGLTRAVRGSEKATVASPRPANVAICRITPLGSATKSSYRTRR